MDDDDQRVGRDRVNRLLWQRLDDAGMRRGKGSATAHAAMRADLTKRLAYMDAENLATLAESLIDAGGGPDGDIIPTEAFIRSTATGLQREPVTQKRIVTSWMASVEGPIAQAAGYHVTLFRWLRKHGRVPLPYDQRRIKEDARDDRRTAEVIKSRVDRGVASDEDRAWLAAWIEDTGTVNRIIADGAAKRDGVAA